MSRYKDQPDGCSPVKSRKKRVNYSKRTGDGDKLRHYYYDGTGKLVGAKVRTADKQFKCEGVVSTLFGMQNFKHVTGNSNKKLVITEGEMDAMSVWEAQPDWPVVSIPNGAAAAKKAIQKNYEWINYYDKIILFFDSDEAGQKAAQRLPLSYHLERFTSVPRGLQGCLRGFICWGFQGNP